MAKIAVIKDYREYAIMMAALAESGGHQTIAESPPIDFERVAAFEPDALITGLFRRRTAFDRPIGEPERDILGLETSREIEAYPAIKVKPIVLIGNGIEEREVPDWLYFDLFLFFPDEMHLFLPRLQEIVTTIKTRRKISGYVCPHCGSRLTYTREMAKDLFCPRCHTAVVLVDGQTCLYAIGGLGESNTCSIDQITARPRHAARPPDRSSEDSGM